jgi:hypothetical protein
MIVSDKIVVANLVDADIAPDDEQLRRLFRIAEC